MALFVYMSDQCHEDIAIHGQKHPVERFREKVERDQHANGFDRFLPTPFLKKAFGSSFRLLAHEKILGEDQVVCFLRFLPRGGNGEYDDLFRSLDNPPASISELIPTNVALEEYLATRKPEGEQNQGMPPLDPAEQAWLEEVSSSRGNWSDDQIVYESREWVQEIRDLKDLHVSLQGLVSRLSSQLHRTELVDPTHKVGILYRYFPTSRRLLLIAPLTRTEDEHIEGQRFRFAKYLQAPEEYGQGEELLRHSARSYPLLFGIERDLWLAIQRDDEANLALSPEESDIISSMRHHQPGRPCFPLFINGRAGSGKSTMIQYLATDYLGFALRNERGIEGRIPLYLTCSKELLDRARGTVQRMLTNHHERLLSGEKIHPEKLQSLLRESFRVFREYLLGRLSDEVRRERFRLEKYVNYGTFCRLWASDMSKRPHARKLSPDLTWHTIRTYIKGMRFGDERGDGGEFGPDEYGELPKKQQSVTRETFATVYAQAWEGWYKPLASERGLWDDQDLAGEVLREGNILPVYPAIFCDEAQDFTRIELDLLFRLSIYSRRSIPGYLLSRVPFIFAGDPFQTLNPTGFRWESVQASFHEKLIRGIDRTQASPQGFNYQELSYNYRSTEKIVKFCNLIQFLRAGLFPDVQIKPQRSWWQEADAPLPCWYSADDRFIRDGLRQPDLIIIVNCDEGQEDEYVENDPLLKEIMEKDETGVARNVYSPIRAKGLEFPRVVLYKFGKTVPHELRKRLTGEPLPENPDKILPLEYFFNRLYVAASRAKRRLFVVDTQEGFDAFWGVLCDPERSEALIDPVAVRIPDWREHCVYLIEGHDWSREREDPLPLAQQMRHRGLAERTPRDLRQARLIFESAGRPEDAKACLAEALELEGQLGDAGRQFQLLGDHSRALACFWRGNDYPSICLLGRASRAIAEDIKWHVARSQTDPKNANELRAMLERLEAFRSDPAHIEGMLDDPQWHKAIGDLTSRLARLDASRLDLPGWRLAFQLLRDLRGGGFKLPAASLAEMAFRANKLQDAVGLWEELGQAAEREERYHEAKSQLEPFPQRIRHLRHLGRWDEIISWWRHHGSLAPDAAVYIGDAIEACRNAKQFDLAVAILEATPRDDLLRGVLVAMMDEPPLAAADLVRQSLRNLVAGEIRDQHWSEAIELTNRKGVEAYAQRHKIPWRQLSERLMNDISPIQTEFVNRLALDDALLAAPTDAQQRVSEALREVFGEGGRAWAGWRRLTTLRQAGSAIERAGKIIDALEFYEQRVEEDALEAKDRHFARERLIRCKEKRVQYLREKEHRGAEADKVEKEARQMRDQWRIRVELPQLPDLTPGAQSGEDLRRLPPRDKDTWKVGRWKFKWTVAEGEGRLQIDDEDQDITAIYYTRKQEMWVESKTVLPDASDSGKEWRSPVGELKLRLLKRGNWWHLAIEHGSSLVTEVVLPD